MLDGNGKFQMPHVVILLCDSHSRPLFGTGSSGKALATPLALLQVGTCWFYLLLVGECSV